ncbi:MAG: hypothetical protein ACRERC_26295, partial [Candidatus Binatia bacterium]
MLPALALTLVTAVAAAVDSPAWPQRYARDGDQLLVYEPQLERWTEGVTLTGHAAVILTPKGGSATSGVLQFTARTDTDQQDRTVMLSSIRVTNAQFPPAAGAAAATLASGLLPSSGVRLSLDTLIAALAASGQQAVSVPLNTTPPAILLAGQPSRLVLFDGAPSFAPIAGTTLQHAINTNWPLLRTSDAPGYYLLDASGWLTSAALETGAWAYVDQLPPSFSTLPATKDWQDVKAQIPGPPTGGQPPLQVYVSTMPAELIVMVGEPQYARIAGTGLYAVQNTQSLVFWDGYAKAYYYLAAGRWFRAAALHGPWTYATGALPADFAQIPPDGPLAAVLASVPNTSDAREAALQAQIPHLASVSRKDAAASVTYDGAPQFAAIEGTSLSYAVNTADDVIRVGDLYYLCADGVWFSASSANGPWTVATAVPDAIYTIPPSSPVYHLTYVRVYQVADDRVVDGYTDGYLGEYVADGVVTWGTGYYYPPYLAAGALPRYYARPYTYGCDAFYNPLTGRFHRGGYGYGPYGGVGAGAVYDPASGTLARGAAAYGPDQSAAAVEAYNPRTGTAAAGYARSNPYAAWEQGVVYGSQHAARGEEYSDDRGSVARVQGSGGGAAVAVSDGDRSAAAVRAPDGDWYAGGDGNLYRGGDDGWQRYGDEAGRRTEAIQVPRAGDTGIPGLGRAVDAGGFAPATRYVPSEGWNPGLAGGLDQAYAVRQRARQLDQRYANWGGRGYADVGGGRYGGFSRGGGGG